MTTSVPSIEIPEDLRAVVSTTFTSWCAWGCVVRTVESAQRPHVCVGEQLIGAVLPDLAFNDVRLLADRLGPLLRELKGDAWEDGVRSGREGLCFGVDDDVPEGQLPDAPLFRGATVTGSEPPEVELPVEPALASLAWHDVTCPEGPDCRDRQLHAASEAVANTGTLDRFLARLVEIRCRRLATAVTAALRGDRG